MAVLDIIGSLFTSIWGLFSVMVPGFGFSFGDLLIAVIAIKLSITLISHVFGFGGSGTSYRSGSAKNPKISDKRKGDEH